MNTIMAIYARLTAALTTDPLLLLASAVAVFDPFWDDFDEEIDYEVDPLTIALQVTRGAFPDIYAAAIERMRAGTVYAELDRLLCNAITAKGIPLDDIEMMGWGIPLTALGVDLEDPDFYTAHNELLPILALFGIDTPQDETSGTDVPAGVHQVGREIARSLHEQDKTELKQLGWLFGWLFSCTGNSLIDCTDAILSEIPPLSWSKDDIAFAVEMIEEADDIMRDALAGLDVLMTTPELMDALNRNISQLSRKLKTKGKPNEQPIRLEWPCIDGGAERKAVDDAQFLFVRPDAA